MKKLIFTTLLAAWVVPSLASAQYDKPITISATSCTFLSLPYIGDLGDNAYTDFYTTPSGNVKLGVKAEKTAWLACPVQTPADYDGGTEHLNKFNTITLVAHDNNPTGEVTAYLVQQALDDEMSKIMCEVSTTDVGYQVVSETCYSEVAVDYGANSYFILIRMRVTQPIGEIWAFDVRLGYIEAAILRAGKPPKISDILPGIKNP